MTRPAYFPADALHVTSGVNHGDALATPDALCLGDGYTLDPLGKAHHTPGLTPLARLTFMTQIGMSVEGVLATDGDGFHFHPLGPFEAGTEYILIAMDAPPETIRGADPAGLCFVRGTRITMSDGAQQAVDRLSPGDLVLTRDAGARPVVWVGRQTVQGAGEFAPVIIVQGALDNEEDLLVGQRHGLMISDWRAEVLAGTRDVLIRAGDLVDDESIHIRRGGHVDYVQIVLDIHAIIYAEGVATETLALTDAVLDDLPDPDRAALADLDRLACRTPLEHDNALVLLRQMGRI